MIEGLLAERTRAGRKQFQVRWRGESPDSWVDAEAVHDQGLIADLRSRLRAARQAEAASHAASRRLRSSSAAPASAAPPPPVAEEPAAASCAPASAAPPPAAAAEPAAAAAAAEPASVASHALFELALLDGLPLRPMDLGRLGLSCAALRALLHHANAHGVWQQAAVRSWGPAVAAGCVGWAGCAQHRHLDFDTVATFGAVIGPTDDAATLELGTMLP